jgi:MFS family permease
VTAELARPPRFFLGWTVVAAAALISFAQVAIFNPTLGVFIPEFEREFGWSRTEISLGVSIGSIVAAATTPFFGPLIDRYGGRRFAVGGSVFLSLSLVAMSQMQTEAQFLVIYGLGRGVAAGLLALVTGTTVSKWFVRRRGYAIGVMSLGTRTGFAVLPLGVQLIIQAADWRTAALSLAGVVALMAVLPALKWMHPRPEALGLRPDGEDIPVPKVTSVATEGLVTAVGDSDRAPADAHHDLEYSWSKRDALHTRAFYLVTLAVALMAMAGGAINLHQIPHLVDRGLSPETAALVITVVAIFGGVGVLAEGWMDARMGARWTMVVGLLGSAFGMVFLMTVNGVPMALAFAVFYGTAFGLLVASNQVVFADYFGRESLGAIRGQSMPAQLGMNAFGPVIAGGAYDLTGSYLAAFIPLTIAYVVAAAALIVARKPTPPAGDT